MADKDTIENPRNPWLHSVSPDEFEAYYEQKQERIERLTGMCEREGCDKKARGILDSYCSAGCESVALRKMSEKLDRLFEEHNVEKP